MPAHNLWLDSFESTWFSKKNKINKKKILLCGGSDNSLWRALYVLCGCCMKLAIEGRDLKVIGTFSLYFCLFFFEWCNPRYSSGPGKQLSASLTICIRWKLSCHSRDLAESRAQGTRRSQPAVWFASGNILPTMKTTDVSQWGEQASDICVGGLQNKSASPRHVQHEPCKLCKTLKIEEIVRCKKWDKCAAAQRGLTRHSKLCSVLRVMMLCFLKRGKNLVGKGCGLLLTHQVKAQIGAFSSPALREKVRRGTLFIQIPRGKSFERGKEFQ